MKKLLKRKKLELYYYKNSKKIVGTHNKISGNVSGISGNVSGISGNVSGISGDLDICEITEEERKRGILIEDLIEKE